MLEDAEHNDPFVCLISGRDLILIKRWWCGDRLLCWVLRRTVDEGRGGRAVNVSFIYWILTLPLYFDPTKKYKNMKTNKQKQLRMESIINLSNSTNQSRKHSWSQSISPLQSKACFTSEFIDTSTFDSRESLSSILTTQKKVTNNQIERGNYTKAIITCCWIITNLQRSSPILLLNLCTTHVGCL